jgi:ABC-type hemin transport system substrate-binding protein
MRALTIESLLSVKPAMVIADPAASPSSVIKRLKDFNISVISLIQVENIGDVDSTPDIFENSGTMSTTS